MKIQVVSYGKRKSGVKTAQIIIKKDGKSFTKHLRYNGLGYWQDSAGKSYDIK